jgi:hypothetical protein
VWRVTFDDCNDEISSHKFEFNIYRKFICADIVIPTSSAHPLNSKKSGFFSMVHRLVHIPFKPLNFDAERDIIYTIAINNGYDPQLVDRIFKKVASCKIKNQLYSPGSTTETGIKF